MNQTRQPILTILAIVAAALIAVTVIVSGQNRALAEPGSEPPGFHGMLVLGSQTIYASHLPMFTPQHRYQGIWQVTFGRAADQTYRDERARAENDGVIFTLAPSESFRLPELTGPRGSFRADVYVGHFERPGHRKLLEDATVTIQRQVHWHPFLVDHERPETLTYLLFSDGEESFLAHWISAVPDYDQILTVAAMTSDQPLPATAQVVVPGRGEAEPLRAGEVVSVSMIEHRGADRPIEITAADVTLGAEFYFEEGELSFSRLEAQAVQ